MNIRQLTEKYFEKWPAKIVCFVLAVILYVFHQVSLVEKRSFVIPLRITENGMVTHQTGLPASVNVIVRASPDSINSISASDIRASINLDDYIESGTFDIPVVLNLSDRLLAIDPLELHVTPEVIKTKVELKKARFVKIRPSIVGEVAHGYEITNVDVNPSYAQVVGGESMIDKLEYIETTKVMVSNASTDFSTEAEYLSVNKLLSVVDKGPYKVTVTVRPAESEKTFENISVLPLHLSKKLQLKKSLPYVSFKLKGKLLNLEKYSPAIDTVRLDFSNVTVPGVYELPLIYSVPHAFTLLEKSDETVTVEVLEAEHFEEEEKDGGENEKQPAIPMISLNDYNDETKGGKA